jgi:glycosyltransferase involved in cell wall biosynthesis
MKIAIVINTSWNIYNFRMGLINALLQEGMEVYAIAPEDSYSHILRETKCKFEPISIDNTGTNPFNDCTLIYELYKIYKRIKPDIILHFTIKPNIYGTMAAKFLNIPIINNVSGLGTIFLNKSYATNIALFMYKLAFQYPNWVFFQNSFDRQVFIDLRLVNNRISEVLPGSGIDIDYFRPAISTRNEKFTFLIISRLIKEKGVIEYIEAARILRSRGIKAVFQVLGAKEVSHSRGIPLETIDEWIEEGIIEYLGVTNDVRMFINNADCIVLPSYREGTPRTLLEAASLAKPIVTTNVPGCNNVVEHGFNGYLCQMKDADDLALKMFKIMNLSIAERLAMGENSRMKIVEKFDERIVIKKYLNAIYRIKFGKRIRSSVKEYIKEKLFVS